MAKHLSPFPRAILAQQLAAYLAEDNFLSSLATTEVQEKLLNYLELLHKWNHTYNLTAVRDPEQMLVKHLMDSLAAAVYFKDYPSVLDVGTGAGLPGIPLAIIFAQSNPQQHFTLLDSLGKRIQFLRQVTLTLKLSNVTIIHSTVEDYHDQLFSCITSRAFTALDRMTLVCQNLLAPEGKYILLKGAKVDEELELLPPIFTCQASHALQVPGLNGERYVTIIQRKM